MDLSGNGLGTDTCVVLAEVSAPSPLAHLSIHLPLSQPPFTSPTPVGLTSPSSPPQVLRENRTLEALVLRDNPLGHTATRHLVRAMQQRSDVEGALKQVGGGGREEGRGEGSEAGGRGGGKGRGSHLMAGLDRRVLPVKLRRRPSHTPFTFLGAPLTSSPPPRSLSHPTPHAHCRWT